MAHGKRGNSSQPDNMPWTRCGLSHEEWNILLGQIGIDITAHENLVGLEGLAKHGQLWEDWIDDYLNGPLRTRFWCTNKRDDVAFSGNFGIIRQVVRTAVSSVAREARLKLAHSTGAIFNSSRASSVAPDTDQRSRTTPTSGTAMGKVKKAMEILGEKKRLDAESKEQVIAPAGLICSPEAEEIPAGCNPSGQLTDRADEINKGRDATKAEAPLPSTALGKKRERPTDICQPETNKMRVGNSIQEPVDKRDVGRMQDIEYSNDFSNCSIVSSENWDKSSAARFTCPAKSYNSALTSVDSLTPPEGLQNTETNLSTDPAEDPMEHPPAKRQKSNTGAIVSIPGEESVRTEGVVQQGSAMVMVAEIPESEFCGNISGHISKKLPSLEQPDAHLRILDKDSTKIANPRTTCSSSKDISSEWAYNPPEPPPEPQDSDVIPLVTDVNSTTTDVITRANQPPKHEDQPSIEQRTTSLPTSAQNIVLTPTDTQINEGPVQKGIITKHQKGVFARMTGTLRASDLDSAMPAFSGNSELPTEDSVGHRCLSPPPAEIQNATPALVRNEILARKTTDEPQINPSIVNDAYVMIEAPAPQALDSAIVDAGPVVEAPRTAAPTSAPGFTFATALFDPIRGIKSSYFLCYAAQAPTLDEFIMTLYAKHDVDQRLGITKLRVFIMGDCVEIGVRAEHRDWDWNTVMGVVKERGCKVSVLFEVVGEYYLRGSKD